MADPEGLAPITHRGALDLRAWLEKPPKMLRLASGVPLCLEPNWRWIHMYTLFTTIHSRIHRPNVGNAGRGMEKARASTSVITLEKVCMPMFAPQAARPEAVFQSVWVSRGMKYKARSASA